MKNDMTKEVALKILERHNDWRRGVEIPMLKPELIGQAIDKAIEVLRLSVVVGQSEQFYCDERDKYGNTECTQQCMACVRDEQAQQ